MKELKKIHNLCRSRLQRGFTLMEMLISVGILAVILAVAGPSVGNAQKNLRMQELDDIARQIFLVQQNRLTAMKTSEELSTFQKELEADLGDQKLNEEADRPQDYDLIDSTWTNLFYLSSDQDITQKHLMVDTDILKDYLSKGSFMTELDPYSGNVYSVFYVKDGAVSRDVVRDLADRKRMTRDACKPRLGYYGGYTGPLVAAALPTEITPHVTVVNAEDLYLQIDCSGLQQIVRTRDKLKISVTITDESGDVYIKEITDFNILATGQLSNAVLVLDSLRENDRFWKTTEGQLTPGDNLDFLVEMTYKDGDFQLQGFANARTNSLFASRTVTDAGTTIEYSRVRHLNNMRKSIYVHPNWTTNKYRKVNIVQTLAIDYDANHWEMNAVAPGKPKETLPYFQAIDNDTIFSRSNSTQSSTDVTIVGSKLELKNFIFGSDNPNENGIGLFKKLIRCTVMGFRFSSAKVTKNANYTNVGVLAAEVDNIQGLLALTDCWVYISPVNERGDYVLTPEKLEECSISLGAGSENIGGLVGRARATAISGCLTAIPITGGSSVGGIAGILEDCNITNSYASGDVTAISGIAGGMAGVMEKGRVQNSYTTSNIIAPKYGGGFIGWARSDSGNRGGTNIINSQVYGEIKKGESQWDEEYSGPMIGNYRQLSTNTEIKGRFLQMGDYNGHYNLEGFALHSPGSDYSSLRVATPNLPSLAFPYVEALYGQAFPFPLVGQGTGANKFLPHYGNWVTELYLQSSLTYYEKYADGTYGYYAVTSLTNNDTKGTSSENLNTWTIDTLREEACVEDGYGIISPYLLKSFTYSLDGGAEKKVAVVKSPQATVTGEAAQLASKISLEAKKADGTKHAVINVNVYQLPFELQILTRPNQTSFYNKLKITGAIESGRNVFKDYQYFYCPDVAKSAVNPDLAVSAPTYPVDPAGSTQPISIRSPRQLNRLGHSYYYWGKDQVVSKGDPFYYLQETDINFATYGKTYCGTSFNLTDTAVTNPYRNLPIGRTGVNNGRHFSGIYDGNNQLIIDYSLATYAQDDILPGGIPFAGLFGEVQKGLIRNVHMVASNPGVEGSNSTGRIVSHFNRVGERAGVGALAGVLWVDAAVGEDPYGSGKQAATIENCSVSGYDIVYDGQGNSPVVVAVGGLVGYNFGYIRNSSAVSKQIWVPQNGDQIAHIGGLVGSSNGKGQLDRCYAGGSLQTLSTSMAKIGGLSGGFDDIPGYGYQNANGTPSQVITKSYSYCTWDEASLPGTEGSETAPVAVDGDTMTIMDTYYLADHVLNGYIFTQPEEGISQTDAELSGLTLDGFGKADVSHTYPWPGFPQAAYPYPAIVKDKASAYIHRGSW